MISNCSIVGASDRVLLDHNKVTHILTVANHIAPFWPEVSASRMILNADHINLPTINQDYAYKVIEVLDSEDTNLFKYFEESNKFIYEAKYERKGCVFVHWYRTSPY